MASDQPDTIRWKSWPASDHPLAAAGGVLVIVAFSMTTWLMGAGVLASVAVGLVLLFIVRRFFLPSSYELSADQFVSSGFLSHRALPWRDVRRIVWDDRGGLVSPRVKSSAWDRRSIIFDWGRSRQVVEPRLRQKSAALAVHPQAITMSEAAEQSLSGASE